MASSIGSTNAASNGIKVGGLRGINLGRVLHKLTSTVIWQLPYIYVSQIYQELFSSHQRLKSINTYQFYIKLKSLHTSWEGYFENLMNILYFIRVVGGEERENLINTILRSADFAGSVRFSLSLLRQAREGLQKIGEVNRNFDRAVQHHLAMINRCISEYAIIDSSLVRLANLVL